eukprot:01802.XXX_700_1020_1 [CDS] Oithona nana genome sequencing.
MVVFSSAEAKEVTDLPSVLPGVLQFLAKLGVINQVMVHGGQRQHWKGEEHEAACKEGLKHGASASSSFVHLETPRKSTDDTPYHGDEYEHREDERPFVSKHPEEKE